MELNEAIALIKCDQLIHQQQTSQWADLGCGSGLFTTALSHYLSAGSCIYAVDKKPAGSIFVRDSVSVFVQKKDFVNDPLDFTPLDGIIMANALHYVKDKDAFIKKLTTYLKPAGILLVLEYDTDKPVPAWVPYPSSYKTLQQLFERQGYTHIEKLRDRPSVYGNANIYTALIHRQV